MSLLFKIFDHIYLKEKNLVYVLTTAEQVVLPFTLSTNARLGDVAIEDQFDITWHTGGIMADKRTQVYVFILKNINDKGKLKEEEIVELHV